MDVAAPTAAGEEHDERAQRRALADDASAVTPVATDAWSPSSCHGFALCSTCNSTTESTTDMTT